MGKIVVKNFWRVGNNGDRKLYEEDLGWVGSSRKDAMSDNSEESILV